MKMRVQAGFTFVETLMALLIFVALTTVVAAGIPTAYHTYWSVVNNSNAQLALSATTSALRDELGMAEKVQVESDGETVRCIETPAGYWESIDNATQEDGYAGLVVRVYAAGANEPGEPLPIRALVPEATLAKARDTSDDRMSIQMDSLKYDGAGVFTVTNLKVMLGSETLVERAEYKVRAVLRPGKQPVSSASLS